MFVTGCTKRMVSAVQDHEKVVCIKASHISSAKTACSNRDTNLARNFLSEENA